MNRYVKPPDPLLLDAGAFDPDRAETSSTLPARWYFEPAIYRLEQARIFSRNWCYQCHRCDIPDAGDCYHGRAAGQAITIQRGLQRELQAWIEPGRQAVACESLAGFVFVNLDANAAPLRPQVGAFIDDAYRCCPQLDRLVRVHRIEREVAANWKTLIDNNHECYHCAANHKSLLQLVDYQGQADWRDSGITFSHAVKRRRLDNPAYALEENAVSQDSLFGYIWPTLIPLWFPGTPSAVLFQVIPTGAESSIARHDFYFLDNEISDQERAFIDYIDKVLVPEDIALCESVQKGLHSQAYRQGKFIVDRTHPEYSEHHVHFFQQFVYRALTEVTRCDPE